jgi:Ser-tRNA(Ala) deacylase AlaX
MIESGDISESEMTDLTTKLNSTMASLVAEGIPTVCSILRKGDAARLFGGEECVKSFPDFIRVVDVAGNAGPCGGTHVKSSSELGGVVVTRIKKKKNILKISYSIQ